MGSRGASSNKISNFETLINKREKLQYGITFGTGIDISNRKGKTTSITSYKIGQLEDVTKNINEAIVQVQQGSYNKRMEQLKNVGFKIVSKTKPDDNEKTTIVLVHIRRK